MSSRWRVAGGVGLAASGWITFALTWLPPEPARAVLAFGYVLFCPGLALVGAAERFDVRRVADPLRRLSVAIAAGTACVALVCEGYYLAGAFTLPRAAITLAAVTTAGALWPLVPARRRTGRADRASGGKLAPGVPGTPNIPRSPANSGSGTAAPDPEDVIA